ncbi:MAG: radical SAM protein [Chloroflexi bacterium]|nr:radical SAM protein [Chloroflexota bacterium]
MTPQNIPLLLTSPESRQVMEGDCACSSSLEIPRPASLNLDSLRIPDGMIHLPLDDDFQIYLPPHGQRGASLLNREAVSVLNSFDLSPWHSHPKNQQKLALLDGFLSQGLLETDAPQPASYSDTLTAWLHITDRCNLLCSYCYLPHVREDMSIETAQAAIQAVVRSAKAHSYHRVKLKYAGGEPLIRFPFILQLHEYAKVRFAEAELNLEAVLLSNGTLLTDEIAQTLASLNIRLMISLDGLGDAHDSQRPHASGKGSFAEVSAGIDCALSSGLVPNISVTVSAKTIDGLPDLLEWVLRKDLPFNLNFYRENELSMQQNGLQYNNEKMIAGLLKAFKVIEFNLPRHNGLGSMIDRANLQSSHLRTCDVGENYLVFDQNGQIAKCQMLMRKPSASIHDQDPLSIIRMDKTGLQNLPVVEKEGCKTCEWKHWCAGGCSLATYRASGRYDVKSPNCNIYKAVFPEALRLEGLRILKYANKSL